MSVPSYSLHTSAKQGVAKRDVHDHRPYLAITLYFGRDSNDLIVLTLFISRVFETRAHVTLAWSLASMVGQTSEQIEIAMECAHTQLLDTDQLLDSRVKYFVDEGLVFLLLGFTLSYAELARVLAEEFAVEI